MLGKEGGQNEDGKLAWAVLEERKNSEQLCQWKSPKQERGAGYWEERGQGVQRLLEEPGHSSHRPPYKYSSLLPSSLLQVLLGGIGGVVDVAWFPFFPLIPSSALRLHLQLKWQQSELKTAFGGKSFGVALGARPPSASSSPPRCAAAQSPSAARLLYPSFARRWRSDLSRALLRDSSIFF